jgi:hypothetical protein
MRLARRTGLAVIAMLITAFSSYLPSQSRIEVFQLAPESPLATNGTSIFGVATDHRTILVSAGAGADWRVLTRRPGSQRITGLAWDRGVLYLADEQSRAVYRLVLDSGQLLRDSAATIPESQVEVVQQGAFRKPRGLAFSLGLLVADPESGVVFQVDPTTRKAEPLVTVPLRGGLEVAADQRTVTIVATKAGEVHQTLSPPFPGYAVDLAIWRTRERRDPPAGTSPTFVQRRFQRIESPSAPEMANGSLYLIDASDGQIYVAFRLQPRAIPIVPVTSVKRPTRLLAFGDSLMVLDGPRGVLDRWPLPVPTEFQLGSNPDLALDALYQYLHEKRLLPVRSVPWRTSLAETLRVEGVIQKEPGPGLMTALCALNRQSCPTTSSGPAWQGAPSTMVIPNLQLESQLDFESISSDELGDATVGERVETGITSAEFRDSKSDELIWELNASRLNALDTAKSRLPNKESWGPYNRERLRYLRRRHFPPGFELTLPVERLRAFVAVPRGVLDDEQLKMIRYKSPGFYWNVLEDIVGKEQSSSAGVEDTTQPPVPCDLSRLGDTLAAMRSTINFKPPQSPLNPVFVGVIDESDVDVYHPTFGPKFDALAFLPARPTPPAATSAPGAPTCGVKFTKERDHATAVSSLIAGRVPGLEGLAGHARIVPMSGKDDALATQITSAFRDRKVRIFNISLHYEHRLVTNLRLKINSMLDALFVVSAGNDVTDSKPVCESATPYPAYPVCEGYRKNVIVVAATGLDGDALIQSSPNPPEPGSNWNDQLIHVAAPGDGYYAAGRDNTYKMVRGTSFAAPLVSATAALLYAKGVTLPWLIKQRIIATADPNDNLIGKVFGTGLLNVERALHEPSHAVLSTTSTTRVVDLEPGDLTITWQVANGGSRTLPLAHVRRLTRSLTGNSYRIVYYDEVMERLIVQNDIEPASWPIKYTLIDPQTGKPTGTIVDDDLSNFRDYVGPIIF